MDNLNFDKQTINKLNSILNNGDINNIISQIPPDTLKNFSDMINNQTNTTNQTISNSANSNNTSNNNKFNNTNKYNDSNTDHNSNVNTGNSSSANYTNNSNFNFDFSKIDINTMMKIKSIMEKMNNNSDPRANLLQSLKPYLRDEKKDKLEQYSNLLNMASIIEIFNQSNNKENSSD